MKDMKHQLPHPRLRVQQLQFCVGLLLTSLYVIHGQDVGLSEKYLAMQPRNPLLRTVPIRLNLQQQQYHYDRSSERTGSIVRRSLADSPEDAPTKSPTTSKGSPTGPPPPGPLAPPPTQSSKPEPPAESESPPPTAPPPITPSGTPLSPPPDTGTPPPLTPPSPKAPPPNVAAPPDASPPVSSQPSAPPPTLDASPPPTAPPPEVVVTPSPPPPQETLAPNVSPQQAPSPKTSPPPPPPSLVAPSPIESPPPPPFPPPPLSSPPPPPVDVAPAPLQEQPPPPPPPPLDVATPPRTSPVPSPDVDVPPPAGVDLRPAPGPSPSSGCKCLPTQVALFYQGNCTCGYEIDLSLQLKYKRSGTDKQPPLETMRQNLFDGLNDTLVTKEQVKVIKWETRMDNAYVAFFQLKPEGQEMFSPSEFESMKKKFTTKELKLDPSLYGPYTLLKFEQKTPTVIKFQGPAEAPGTFLPMAPAPAAGEQPMDGQGDKEKNRLLIIIASAAGAFMLLVLVAACAWWFFVWRVRDKEEDDDFSKIDPYWKSKNLGTSVTSSKHSFANTGSESVVGESQRRAVSTQIFTFEELQAATNNWDDTMVLGEGGFGRVYRGKLQNGQEVAIKKLSSGGHQGDREFVAEIDMLSRLHHRHLVKLVGYYSSRDVTQQLLCYELVPNDSLETHLHSGTRAPLDWPTRLKIALGAAKGLAYLHEGATPCVIHRDLKASNILLENDFTAKVADFGLAKLAPEGNERDYVTTRVMGTFGYVAPEYAMTGHLLVKSDVYSYGVVLLELLSGRKPVDMSQPQGQENLVTWARPLLKNRNERKRLELADPKLDLNTVPLDAFMDAAAIADACVHPEANERPIMTHVVQALTEIIQRSARGINSEELASNASGNSYEMPFPPSFQDSPNTSQIFPPGWPENLRPPPGRFGAGESPARFGGGSGGASGGRGTGDRPSRFGDGVGRLRDDPTTRSPFLGPLRPPPGQRSNPQLNNSMSRDSSNGLLDYDHLSRAAAISEDLTEGR